MCSICKGKWIEAGGYVEPAPAAPFARDWSELPFDALTSVFAKLGAVDILMGAGLVCHSWLDTAKVPTLWRYLDMASDDNKVVQEKCRSGAGGRDILCAMAKEAVDRSCGQLEVFIGEEFVDDDLIKYIGGRAPSLKILHLTSCSNVLNGGFVKAINRFPLLEELKLLSCDGIGGRAAYMAVGKACPNLKRLEVGKYFTSPYLSIMENLVDRSGFHDDEAHGIATVHGLRSLKISYKQLKKKGLYAILDNCPHLESVELYYCMKIIFVDDAIRAKYAGTKLVVFPDLQEILSSAANYFM